MEDRLIVDGLIANSAFGNASTADGAIRLFPNWDKGVRASFSTLRARGAFLVSATVGEGEVADVEIYSEKGASVGSIIPGLGSLR